MCISDACDGLGACQRLTGKQACGSCTQCDGANADCQPTPTQTDPADDCGSCQQCDGVGACTKDDTCCQLQDSEEIGWGNCGQAPDKLLPDGCDVSYSQNSSYPGTSSGSGVTYACNNGILEYETGGGGGSPCPSCDYSWASDWSDSCGAGLNVETECTDSCLTRDAPNYQGQCGDAPWRTKPNGCLFTHTRVAKVGGTTFTKVLTYQCNNNVWDLEEKTDTQAPCPGCSDEFTDTWSDSCGNNTAKTETCANACWAPDAEITPGGLMGKGYCDYAESIALPEDCIFTRNWNSSTTTSSAGGTMKMKCENGAWIFEGNGGGGGPCSSCTPNYQDNWSDECGNLSAKETQCTSPIP